MGPSQTEPMKTGKTHYNHTHCKGEKPMNHVKHKAKGKEPRTMKVNELEFSTRNYKPPVRHFNRGHRNEKSLNTVCFKINKIHSGINEREIKKNLNKKGIQPVKLKLEKNTLNHKHKGKGMIVIENSNSNNVKTTKDMLKSMNIEVKSHRNFFAINKY